MKRACHAAAVVVLTGGAVKAEVITTDPYLYGSGRDYQQTGAATHYQVGTSFFDVFVELDMNGPPIWGDPSGPITNRPPVNTVVHGSINGSPMPTPWDVPAEATILDTPGASGHYDTEMLELNLSGGNMPPGVMIRESPTLASNGQTNVTDLGGGVFRIDSFFDVFTELSLDNGQTWTPSSNGPSHVDLMPAPGGVVALGLGALAVCGRRRR
jgi:hypothetical protein